MIFSGHEWATEGQRVIVPDLLQGRRAVKMRELSCSCSVFSNAIGPYFVWNTISFCAPLGILQGPLSLRPSCNVVIDSGIFLGGYEDAAATR